MPPGRTCIKQPVLARPTGLSSGASDTIRGPEGLLIRNRTKHQPSPGLQVVNVDASSAPIGSYDEIRVTQAPIRLPSSKGLGAGPFDAAQSICVKVTVTPQAGRHQSRYPRGTWNVLMSKPPLSLRANHGFDVPAGTRYGRRQRYRGPDQSRRHRSRPDPPLGCKSISVGQTPSTMGSLESAAHRVSSSGGGWTLDPAFPVRPLRFTFASPCRTAPRVDTLFPNLPRQEVNNALQTIGDHGYEYPHPSRREVNTPSAPSELRYLS
jgi:hypothetical protein